MTLTLNPLLAMVIAYLHAEVRGQRSVGTEDSVETKGRTEELTDRRTDGGDCITCHVNAVDTDGILFDVKRLLLLVYRANVYKTSRCRNRDGL